MNAALVACTTLLCAANAVLVGVAIMLCRSQDALTKILSDDYRRAVEPQGESRMRAVRTIKNKDNKEDET